MEIASGIWYCRQNVCLYLHLDGSCPAWRVMTDGPRVSPCDHLHQRLSRHGLYDSGPTAIPCFWLCGVGSRQAGCPSGAGGDPLHGDGRSGLHRRLQAADCRHFGPGRRGDWSGGTSQGGAHSIATPTREPRRQHRVNLRLLGLEETSGHSHYLRIRGVRVNLSSGIVCISFTHTDLPDEPPPPHTHTH